MLNLKISEEPVNILKNKYKLSIGFMLGDADGYEDIDVFIDKDKLDNDKKYASEVETLVVSILDCIKKDSRGRRGYDDMQEMFEDHYKNEEIKKFIIDYNEYDEELEVIYSEYKDLMFYFPHESNSGFYHSFQTINTTYYDENSTEFKVIIEVK